MQHGICQEHIFFCTDAECPSFLLLIIPSGWRNGNNFTSALKLINWVVAAVSHLWNLLTLEARKQWSATAHVCLVGVRASELSCPLLVRSMCYWWLQDRLIKSLNHLGWHCCLGLFQWPTEYSGFCRPGKSVLAQEMCIIANTMKNYKRGKSRRCEVFFLAQALLNYNVKNRRGKACLCLITWQKIEMSGRRYNKEACLRTMNTFKAQYYILLNLPNHWISSHVP